jgi:hypothetical protein
MHIGMSYSNKRLKTEAYYASVKEKVVIAPSTSSNNSDKYVSSHMHWKDDCSHVISQIRPKGSTQQKADSGKSKGDNNNQGKITSQSGKSNF